MIPNHNTIEILKEVWPRLSADEALRERLKEAKGIGTPATRAEIIRGLKAQEFLISQAKSIVPTERGLTLFDVLQKADPALVDPGVTAQMERLLDQVLVGETPMMGAIDAVCAQASRIIDRLMERAASGAEPLVVASPSTVGPAGPDRPPTPAMKAYVVSLAQGRGLKPPRGYTSSGAICRAFLDKHASRKRDTAIEPQAAIKCTSSAERPRSSNVPMAAAAAASKGRKRNAASLTKKLPVIPPATALPKIASPPGETRLNIPFGNKETAQKLGARYRDGAWYGPAGLKLV